MLFRDYMILLRLLDSHKKQLSTRSILAFQELLPFSLQGLVETIEGNEGDSLQWLLDEALTDILRSRLQQVIVATFESEEKLRSLNKESLEPIIRTCQKIKQGIKSLIHNFSLDEENQSVMKRLIYFKDEIVDKLCVTLIKFTQVKSRESLMAFFQLVIEHSLAKGTPAEVHMCTLLDLIDSTFERLIEKYQDYQVKVTSYPILDIDIKELSRFCIKQTVLSEEWYLQLPPLITMFVEQLINNLRETNLKLHSKSQKYPEIKAAIKSNIQFMFFSFEDTAHELKLFIETEKNIMDWEKRVGRLEMKLREAKELDDNSLLSSDRRSEILVSTEEFQDAFRCLHTSEAKFIKDQPKYKSLLEKDKLSILAIEDEDLSFQDVMNDYVRECIPLNPSMIAIIEREAMSHKVDQLLNSTIMIKESELEQLVFEFEKYAVSEKDKDDLAKLKQLRQDLDLILDPNYPENIDPAKRHKDVRDQSQRLSRVFIEGPCKEKIKKLCRVINFISELEDYLGSDLIYYKNSGNSKVGGEKGGSAEENIDWSKMDFLKKSLFFKNKYIPLFPDIEAVVHSVYRRYMGYLVEQASAHGEKTDISTILLIETIYMNIHDKPELNPIYVRRRESLVSLLRGSIELHHANNLTVTYLKAQVEELLEKKRYLKGFSEDKTSKVNQAIAFLNQLETLALLLRRVKVFRKEDVSVKNRDMYRNIAEAIRSLNMKDLPLLESELTCSEVFKFCQFFDGVIQSMDEWEQMKLKITDVHCTLPKYIQNNQLSHALLQIFDLPEIAVAHSLCEKLAKYTFLDDTEKFIRAHIEETEQIESHLDDSDNYKKVSNDIEQFKSSSTRKELQVYLQFLMKKKLPQIWFVTPNIKNRLRFYWVYNKLTALLYEPISLNELAQAYQEAKTSNKCNDYVWRIIEENKVVATIENRIVNATKLRNDLQNCKKFTADQFFQLLSQIRNSTVYLFGPNETPSSEALDRYLSVMERVEKNYPASKGNLANMLTFEEYQQSTRDFTVPDKIKESVLKQLREPIEHEKWFEKLLEQSKVHRLELSLVVTDKPHAESKAYQQLEKLYTHEESSLNKVQTQVEEITLSNLFGSEDKVKSLKHTLASIGQSKYFCEGDQLLLFIRLIIWLLKETEIFEERGPTESQGSKLTYEILEVIDLTCTTLKANIQAPIKPFIIEELLKSKSNRHLEMSQNSLQEPIECKEVEELSALWIPLLSKVSDLFSRIVDASIKHQHGASEANLSEEDLLSQVGLPDTLISRIDIVSVFQSKPGSVNGQVIQNDLIDAETSPLELTRVPYQKLMDRSTELLASYKKFLQNKLEVAVAIVEPVRSRRPSLCSPIKDFDATSAEKKKLLNTKVVDAKKNAKNSSDQKENEIESRGKMLDLKTRKAVDFSSRKQSHTSTNGHAKEEDAPQLVPLSDNNHKLEDKQLKKRKPEVIKEEKKDLKSEKKTGPAVFQQAQAKKLVMFESLTLKYKDRRLDNKKVNFVSVAYGLDETVIDQIGLRGQIELELSAITKSDQFNHCKALIRKEVPLIYGHLSIRSNEISQLLEENMLWEGQNDRLGRIWIFSSKLDKDFVIEHNFLPPASTLNTKAYYLFIFEKRVDGKDLDTSTGHVIPRKGRGVSPEVRKNGNQIVDETKSQRDSKSRSIKGDRAARSRKNAITN
jgi:hypothetical protein